jgi:hypothetical protein
MNVFRDYANVIGDAPNEGNPIMFSLLLKREKFKIRPCGCTDFQ